MSVRRLADEAIQPATFAFTKENQAWAEKKMAEYPPGRQQSAVIPVLFRAQEQQGWISRAVIENVANLLGMPYIRVLEVATFYTQFQLKPVGTVAHVQVCGTTPCMLRGAEDIRHVCERKISHEPFEVTPDGKFSWEEVECLGACVNAPLVMIGSDTYEDLTPESFEAILDKFAAGKGDEVKPGPQVARQFGAAEGGATTLLEKPTAKRTYKPFPPPPEAPAAPAGAVPAPAAATPTAAGGKNKTTEETAPALKSPSPEKVSPATAEGERKAAATSAKADGAPNKAMREEATGAESPAGKIDAGKTDTKAKRVAAPAAVSSPTRETGGPLFTPPPGAKDDLKLISGVGPVLEGKLNAAGITTWAQVAALKKADIDRLEAHLAFPGRVARDEWIKQAKALAKGGVEEYRRVFGKDPR
ncbi:MAG: NADH-quinone oxidoreductase subunit NuoE [Devosia sp.]|uniref:NADH-quinone oxidoreductase subunit NuoE n=1 Tax=Devosia sp. TaxID=1871048 RepID=UPI001AD228FD|nr:NADH-quinone oxidoreductase subunit NuoE [Devosia sp.]MBN9314414.1 NADH-quinone oxidoreductase subunit NuoE [Devosia sp.]